jgi:hypothetical protein
MSIPRVKHDIRGSCCRLTSVRLQFQYIVLTITAALPEPRCTCSHDLVQPPGVLDVPFLGVFLWSGPVASQAILVMAARRVRVR